MPKKEADNNKADKKLARLMEEEINEQRIFRSQTYGELTLKEVLFHVRAFMNKRPHDTYKVIIGSDSHAYTDHVIFISTVILYHEGKGGIYFWTRRKEEKTYALATRMYQEAADSMVLATEVMEQIQVEGFIPSFNLEIHVDVGNEGKTREVIDGVVGMIKASGFAVKAKPEGIGASKIADRHT